MSAITSDPRPVSVVVPTWNGGERFRRVLDILARQDVPGGLQLVVIDSGSRDGTREAAAAAGALVVDQDQATFNHGATRNRGIEASAGQVVVLLTQDALPISESFVTGMLRPFADAAVDGAYGRQYPLPDADPILKHRLEQWSASRDEPALQHLVQTDEAASLELFDELPPLERYLRCAFDNVASAVRRSSWELRPFPPRNFGEDVAWARRILLAGGTIAYEPSAEVEHSHPISIKREFFRLYRDHKNLYELFGLQNVPSWERVRQGWSWGIGHYKDLLAGLDLTATRRAYWRMYSVPYSLAETTAQFLGARSHWKSKESRLWKRFDDWACAD